MDQVWVFILTFLLALFVGWRTARVIRKKSNNTLYIFLGFILAAIITYILEVSALLLVAMLNGFRG